VALKVLDRKKIMYGSDFPVAQTRGKVIDVERTEAFLHRQAVRLERPQPRADVPDPVHPVRLRDRS